MARSRAFREARQGKPEVAGAALLSRQRALSAVADAASVEAARAVAHAAAVAWWQAGAGTTILCGHMAHWDTGRQHRRSFSRLSLLGSRRYADRPCQPHKPWRPGQR